MNNKITTCIKYLLVIFFMAMCFNTNAHIKKKETDSYKYLDMEDKTTTYKTLDTIVTRYPNKYDTVRIKVRAPIKEHLNSYTNKYLFGLITGKTHSLQIPDRIISRSDTILYKPILKEIVRTIDQVAKENVAKAKKDRLDIEDVLLNPINLDTMLIVQAKKLEAVHKDVAELIASLNEFLRAMEANVDEEYRAATLKMSQEELMQQGWEAFLDRMKMLSAQRWAISISTDIGNKRLTAEFPLDVSYESGMSELPQKAKQEIDKCVKVFEKIEKELKDKSLLSKKVLIGIFIASYADSLGFTNELSEKLLKIHKGNVPSTPEERKNLLNKLLSQQRADGVYQYVAGQFNEKKKNSPLQIIIDQRVEGLGEEYPRNKIVPPYTGIDERRRISVMSIEIYLLD